MSLSFQRGVSRRVLMQGALALGFLPAGALAQSLDAPPAHPEQAQTPPPTVEAATVDTIDDVNLMTIEVSLNGKGPFRFIVDTGSEKTVLTDTLVTRLQLEPRGAVRVQGVIRTITTQMVRVDTLAFGPFSHDNLTLPVLPREFVQADGILGLDIIRNGRVVFDFKKQQLHVQRPAGRNPLDDGNGQTLIVRATGNGGRLRSTDCYIDGVRTSVFVDTGAQSTIGNPALGEGLRKRHPRLIQTGDVRIQGMTGGEMTGEGVTVKEIRLNDLLFATGTIVLADVRIFRDWGLAQRPAMLLGMDFLRQFSGVSIDYRRKEILFEMSGLERIPKSV